MKLTVEFFQGYWCWDWADWDDLNEHPVRTYCFGDNVNLLKSLINAYDAYESIVK